MHEVAELRVDPKRAVVFEHGWQSWSPTRGYRLGERAFRPVSANRQVMNYRPDRQAPADAFWGEGLLAVDPGTGEDIQVFAVPHAAGPIASIRADVDPGQLDGSRLIVRADGEVSCHAAPAVGGLEAALARWAEGFAAAQAVGPLRPAPTLWCSWYHYFTAVTEADIDENVDALDELDLDVDVVQVDDGYQAEIGDWLGLSGRFRSLPDTVARIRDHGRRAGIWVAPFLVGARSELVREHPDWLVSDAHAGVNWEQQLYALDVTHAGAADYLRQVFSSFRDIGIDFFKIDFVYAGALEGGRADPAASGVEAYRLGLRLIREAIGPQAYLLGCGAPSLPSVGLVDAMRIGPDTASHYEPLDGDMSQPSGRAAAMNTRSRAWQHGRFWVNDPDCLIAAPNVERRQEWAEQVERHGGLRGSSDRLRGLDDWGIATTRRLLTHVSAAPFDVGGRTGDLAPR